MPTGYGSPTEAELCAAMRGLDEIIEIVEPVLYELTNEAYDYFEKVGLFERISAKSLRLRVDIAAHALDPESEFFKAPLLRRLGSWRQNRSDRRHFQVLTSMTLRACNDLDKLLKPHGFRTGWFDLGPDPEDPSKSSKQCYLTLVRVEPITGEHVSQIWMRFVSTDDRNMVRTPQIQIRFAFN
jgi:hypothetical protein